MRQPMRQQSCRLSKHKWVMLACLSASMAGLAMSSNTVHSDKTTTVEHQCEVIPAFDTQAVATACFIMHHVGKWNCPTSHVNSALHWHSWCPVVCCWVIQLINRSKCVDSHILHENTQACVCYMTAALQRLLQLKCTWRLLGVAVYSSTCVYHRNCNI